MLDKPAFATDSPLLVFEQVACVRGERRLFSGLSFALAAGEILWLRGANGSGKSSLLRLAAGLLPATQGKVTRGSAVALLGDDSALDREQTLADALGFWAKIGGVSHARQTAALAAMGLEQLCDKPIATLSAGQCKRADIARIIASDAPLWLLDEPYNLLDQKSQRLLSEAIYHHCTNGGAVVVTTHQQPPTLSLPTHMLTLASAKTRIETIDSEDNRNRSTEGDSPTKESYSEEKTSRSNKETRSPIPVRVTLSRLVTLQIVTLFSRDVRRLWGSGAPWLAVVFFLLISSSYPFVVGADSRLLAASGGAVVWIAVLLANFLPIEHLLRSDYQSGVLDHLLLHGIAEETIAAIRIAAHSTAIGLPLLLALLPSAGLLHLSAASLSALGLGLAIALPAIAALAVVSAALTVRHPSGNLIASLLVLPFAIPLLIFGAGLLAPALSPTLASDIAHASDRTASALLWLIATSLFLTALSPFATGAVLHTLRDS